MNETNIQRRGVVKPGYPKVIIVETLPCDDLDERLGYIYKIALQRAAHVEKDSQQEKKS